MSSYTKYHKTYYYKKMWKKEKAMMCAYAERNVGELGRDFIDKHFLDFNVWLEVKGIKL